MAGSVLTPWGSSNELRERKLSPGPGTPREDVERNQRERLYGAMVAVIDEVGYEGMRVGNVAARAGVSRGALYEYFQDRQECFSATFDALVEAGMERVSVAYHESSSWDQGLRAMLDTLIELLVAQPAAARLCFLETYAAGSDVAANRQRFARELERLARGALGQSPERVGMPPPIVKALVGGVRTVIQTRLRRGAERELIDLADDLWQWVLSYPTPQPPLRRARASTPAAAERFEPDTQMERLLMALAFAVNQKGYAETTVADVATTAGTSLSTFYAHFDSKESAFLAACDVGVRLGFQATMSSYERESDWPQRAGAGLRELLSFLATEPEWAYMANVEVLAAGKRAQARRDRTLDLFTALIQPGYELAPALSPVAAEAIGGAIYALIYSHICEHGAERLPELWPTGMYLILAPFVGSRAAVAIANA